MVSLLTQLKNALIIIVEEIQTFEINLIPIR